MIYCFQYFIIASPKATAEASKKTGNANKPKQIKALPIKSKNPLFSMVSRFLIDQHNQQKPDLLPLQYTSITRYKPVL